MPDVFNKALENNTQEEIQMEIESAKTCWSGNHNIGTAEVANLVDIYLKQLLWHYHGSFDQGDKEQLESSLFRIAQIIPSVVEFLECHGYFELDQNKQEIARPLIGQHLQR